MRRRLIEMLAVAATILVVAALLQLTPSRVAGQAPPTPGEPAAADALRRRIEERFRIPAVAPESMQEFDL